MTRSYAVDIVFACIWRERVGVGSTEVEGSTVRLVGSADPEYNSSHMRVFKASCSPSLCSCGRKASVLSLLATLFEKRWAEWLFGFV